MRRAGFASSLAALCVPAFVWALVVFWFGNNESVSLVPPPPTHNSWHSPEPRRHGGGVLHSVHRPYARLITCNWHRVKCLCAAEWQQPPVTWIKSSTYDGALSVELKARRPPPQALTQHTPTPPRTQCYLPPSGLLHVAHSSAQCWNMAERTDKWRHRCPPSIHHAYSSSHQLNTVKGGPRKGERVWEGGLQRLWGRSRAVVVRSSDRAS